MKIKRTLPHDTPDDERAMALAKRLGIIKRLELYKRLGLNSRKQLSVEQRDQWIGLWALIGMELAKKEPEFGRPGRRPGSKNKQQIPYDDLDPEAQNKRRYRERHPVKRSHLKLSDLVRMGEDEIIRKEEEKNPPDNN